MGTVRRPPPDRADVVVVGAGIAGLIAAATTAAAGRRTVLLEANHQAGGLMSGIRRKGYTFDCGDQSFENSGLLFPILRQLGIDPERRLHRASHRFVGTNFDYRVTSLDDVERAIVEAVPHEEGGVRALFDRLRRIEKAQLGAAEGLIYPMVLPHADAPAALRRALLWGLRHGRLFNAAAQVRYRDVIERHIADAATREVLGHTGYGDQSLLIAAGLWTSWIHDYWYPKGGMQSFMNDLLDATRGAGAQAFFRRAVTRVIEEGDAVAGVELADGSTVLAPRVVWAADAKALYGRVLSERHRDTPRARRFLGARVSDTMCALYLGLDMPPEELRGHLGATHVFHFHDEVLPRVEEHMEDRDIHADIWLQWNAPILHGEPFAPEGHSAVVLHAFSHPDWMDRWGTGRGGDAGKERYRAIKRRVQDQMISGAERLIPGIAERVTFAELGSPLALERFTGNAGAATAGWTFAPEGRPFRAPGASPNTPLKGLYMGGQWAIWPGGVPFAALSGKLAAELALDGWPRHLWRMVSGSSRR